MKKKHRNALDSEEPQHLYAIHDRKRRDIYKYGISSDPIGKDGLSDRVRDQVKLFNLIAGWARFFAEIILRAIPGRKKALQIEDEYIERYRQKHGHKPRGNRK